MRRTAVILAVSVFAGAAYAEDKPCNLPEGPATISIKDPKLTTLTCATSPAARCSPSFPKTAR